MREEEHSENVIMKAFRRFKLENTLLTCKYKVDNEFVKAANLGENSVEQIVLREISIQLSNQMLNQHRSEFKSSLVEGGQFTEYEVQLLVIGLKDFKTVVEAAIQLMPEEQIKNIRNGKS